MTEGWAAIPNWLVRHKGVTPNMIAVYAVIQSHAGSKGTTRLLMQTIADEAGMSYSSAQRSCKALNAMGVLWWEAQGAATKRTASVYHPLQEADPDRVEAAHRPASKREPVRSDSTVTETVLEEADPQDSADQYGQEVAENDANTVTAVRSQGPYVRSQGPREEEPSKKNPSPTSSSASVLPDSYSTPYPGGGMPKPAPLSWYPSKEIVEQVKGTYPWATDVTLRAITMALIAFSKKNKREPDDSLWLTFCRNENRDREAAERKEREASGEKKKSWVDVAD